MIKRPLNEGFRDKVLEEIKFTTIRDKAWPVGVPIMLYSWTGAPYRSRHLDLCAVVVRASCPIWIHRSHTHESWGEAMGYEITAPAKQHFGHFQLWKSEGFDSAEEMDAWFRPLLKVGERRMKWIMKFDLYASEGLS